MTNSSPFNKSLLTVLSLVVLLTLIPTSQSEPYHTSPQTTKYLATRSMRYHHILFHNIRSNWNRLDKETKTKITAWGWAPPRPAKDSQGKALNDNNSGEDFLFMHRSMINLVNKLDVKYGFRGVTGFTTLPAKSSTLFPMSPAYTANDASMTNLVKYYKTDDWYKYMKQMETKLNNSTFLRTLTLGQLGSYIEWASDIHQGMHFRFSNPHKTMRQRVANNTPSIDPKWDAVSYDWLVDIYSSHVNPWFWKLHGWINNRVDVWARANNISSIKWKGTWTGGQIKNLPKDLNVTDDPNVRFLAESMDSDPNEPHAAHMTNMDIDSMEKVVRLLADQGILCEFYHDLNQEYTPKFDLDRRK